MSAPYKTLTNPALLRHICLFSESSDYSELLRVSRLFFKVAAPLVWENIHGVETLLLLVPGVKCLTLEEDNAKKIVSELTSKRIQILTLLYQEHLSR
jgi:hypothetical protein